MRLPIAGFGLSSGISFSGGPYYWCESCPFEQGQERKWAVAYWLNVDATLEYRWATGLVVGAFAGYGGILNPDSYRCTAAPPCGGFPDISRTPFGGFKIGYWFRPLE